MSVELDPPPKRALALCGGGVVGGLYEVGALLALDTLFEDFTTADFDFYVGSSAGAVVAALLANGVRPVEIRDALEGDGRALPRLSGAQFLALPWAAYLRTLPALAWQLPRRALDLWIHRREALVLDTLAALLGVLPPGALTLDGIEAWVRQALTRSGRTNDFRRLRRRLLVPATALETGEIRIFGARLNERTPISRAVAASAAIPIVFAPVRIDGADYVDATVTKTAHAGLAADRGARLIVVVNPLRPVVLDPAAPHRLADGGPLAVAGQALRIAVHRRMHEAFARYDYTRPGTDVVMFEPYERDLELFGYPLMTYARRQEVIRRGYRTTIKRVLAQYDRMTLLFARHGLALRPRSDIDARARIFSSDPRLRLGSGLTDASVARSVDEADVVPRPAKPARQNVRGSRVG